MDNDINNAVIKEEDNISIDNIETQDKNKDINDSTDKNYIDPIEKEIPMIPLRGMTIFPNMVIHFDVGRQKSIDALEEAMNKNQQIFLVSQRKAKVEEPSEEDIYDTGTLCVIKQLLKLPGEIVRVLVEGKTKAKITAYKSSEPFFKVTVAPIVDIIDESDKEIKGMVKSVQEAFGKYMKLTGSIPGEVLVYMDDLTNPSELADSIGAYLELSLEEKQTLLKEESVYKRLEIILIMILNENEVLKVEKKIGLNVKKKIDKSQKDFFLREQMKAIQEELGEDDDEKREIKDYQNKINKAKLPATAKNKALGELNKLKSNSMFSSESGVIKTYIDLMVELPWNKLSKESLDIEEAKRILDEEHYGLTEVKERIIEYLAVKKFSNGINAPIICFVGPPGVGKTSIAKSIAKAMNRTFVRMSLGGVKDEADIRGHRRTYVGSIPGRIINGIKEAKTRNPLFLLDEIDKLSNDYKGNPADALLEVLDGEQNDTFRDHYLEIDFDLSKVMFVTTANSLDTIPRPLLDRMEIIEVDGYTYEEKYNIAVEHLVPRILKEHNVIDAEIIFSPGAIRSIINNYTRESGVRELERKISAIVRKAITEIVKSDTKKINVTTKHVVKYLGEIVFDYDKMDKDDKIGVVTGLAWTAYGGDTLPVEVSVMEGTGKLQLTGKLGEVMQESAKTAYSYVRSNAKKFGITDKFYKDKDIHIHAPEGAVPKDGPSAGVTMVTALVSALGNKKVKHNVAMTGEITLTGKVLPIGGLREKSLAAYRMGIDTLIIPEANKKDLKKIPSNIKNKITFILAKNAEDVLSNAFVSEENYDN